MNLYSPIVCLHYKQTTYTQCIDILLYARRISLPATCCVRLYKYQMQEEGEEEVAMKLCRFLLLLFPVHHQCHQLISVEVAATFDHRQSEKKNKKRSEYCSSSREYYSQFWISARFILTSQRKYFYIVNKLERKRASEKEREEFYF